MPIDKFKLAQQALIRFEKHYGSEVLNVFSVANADISRELTDGMVAGVPQRAIIDNKKFRVVPIILTKKAGDYGELGVILIDDQNHTFLGGTDRSAIFGKAEMFVDEKS